MIVHGDCLEVMAGLEPESVASVVTDPPYDLTSGKRGGTGIASVNLDSPYGRSRIGTGNGPGGFMGKAWDGTGIAFRPDTWALAFAAAKPGAHLLAFGGTRTVHRMTCAIEDAGWEVRDCLVWGYASGFPKSHNLKGEWDGWGTALKPAWEPIIMARKPLRGTVAANVAVHGTGALNIDGTRIGTEPMPSIPGELGVHAVYGRMHREPSRIGEASADRRYPDEPGDFAALPGPRGGDPAGRWPANVILTDPIFDGGIVGVIGGGDTSSGLIRTTHNAHVPSIGGVIETGAQVTYGGGRPDGWRETDSYGDSGTYSRFFLIPKADRAEREPVGLRTFDQSRETAHRRTGDMDTPYLRGETMRRNTHPTVKPVDLMRHLIRLVTPPGGLVLDPFLGSGTTGIACEMEGFDWIGIEKEAEYVAIAQARLEGVQRGFGLSA